jgi:NHS family xanthosine MFS transporter
MLAWVLRFGLFVMDNLNRWFWMIIMSCVVYGMAFDFFNISGSLFVETNTEPKKSFVSTRVIHDDDKWF